MIPFHIVLLSDEKPDEKFIFETNEKPFKGDTFILHKQDGSVAEVKIIEVNKVIVQKDNTKAILEYHCKTELHEQKSNAIGFGKH